ncbi:MAG: methyltransferase domain-containing protein [Actinomycetota bacterium]|nr:methyltransferase domain-containing protein [Actinomycetota bacterium]
MKEFYEDLWQRLPAELVPPDFALRRAFMLEEVSPGDRVLDLGCGAGQFTRELADAGALPVGVEVAEAALGRARAAAPELDFRLAPIDAPLPLPDGSFELVWASEVIEHVADTALWLSEMARVLVPGGRLLLSTPAHGRLLVALRGIERFSEPLGDHLHLYTRGSLRTVLGEFGFEQIRIRAVGGPPLLRRMLLARALGGGSPGRAAVGSA